MVTIQDILQIANLGIIPILLWVLVQDRKVNEQLRIELKDVNQRLLTMIEKSDGLQRLINQAFMDNTPLNNSRDEGKTKRLD